MRLNEIKVTSIQNIPIGNIEGIRDEIYKSTFVNPLAEHELIWPITNPKVAFELQIPWNNQILLAAIRSLERGKGYGSEGLQWLCSLADKYKVAIFCSIQPFGQTKPKLTIPQLRSWYKRYGFVKRPGQDYLVRLPK